jgi:glycosyltransferase involved in cell wall biosynthesis
MVEVSTCIISYNQEKYIADAIESALMQEASFETEIIISDDCSTDNTTKIIRLYTEKYPNKVKAFFSEKNTGMLKNWQRALTLCNGKYIALLEGDDFWNDKRKIQKQYEILETNQSYAFSFTNAHIKYENQLDGFPHYVVQTGEEYSTVDLFNYNFIPTCSVLMRNNISGNFFHPAYFKSPFADWIIHILNSQLGNIHFLNDFTCTYRVHDAGVWSGIKEEKRLSNKLKAIECIAEIISAPELQMPLKQSLKQTLQELCTFYKLRKNCLPYIKYRTKLFLS